MKLKLKLSAFTLGLLLLMGCNNTDGKTNSNTPADNPVQSVSQNLKFESYTYNLIGRLTHPDSIQPDIENSDLVRFSGEGVIPARSPYKHINALRDSLLSMAGFELNEQGKPTPTPDPDIELTDIAPDTVEACGETDSSISASLISPRVTVFEVRVYNYFCGAAHGYTNTRFINYSMQEGTILRLDDLFSPGSDRKLTALIRSEVSKLDISLLIPLNQIDIPDTFSVTDQGVDFYFNPYEIATYSDGLVTVSLSLPQIESLLSDHGYWILTGKSRDNVRNK